MKKKALKRVVSLLLGALLLVGCALPAGALTLDLEKTYTLASHNYMLKNAGDGFTMFQNDPILQDEVMLDNQVLINYITGTLGGNVGEAYANPYGDGRIVAVTEAPAE